jgi:large subunit ribosomal protein L1
MSVPLPAGNGKDVRVVVFTDDTVLAEQALKAGAIRAGLNDLMTEIENGFLDFDYCIATPSVMKNLSKVAKKLGPRGLMPNPKLGNITDDVITVLNQARKGKVNLKNDKAGIIHACVGKINFNNEDLIANIKAVINTIKEAKPEVVKGRFIKSVYLSTTMGPSVAVKLETLL